MQGSIRFKVMIAYSVSMPIPWYPKGAEAMAETTEDVAFFESWPGIFQRIVK